MLITERYTHSRSKFGTGVSVEGRRENVHVGSTPDPCWQSLCRTSWRLLGRYRNLKCERYMNSVPKFHSLTFMKAWPSPRQMKARGVTEGAVTRSIGRREPST